MCGPVVEAADSDRRLEVYLVGVRVLEELKVVEAEEAMGAQ